MGFHLPARGHDAGRMTIYAPSRRDTHGGIGLDWAGRKVYSSLRNEALPPERRRPPAPQNHASRAKSWRRKTTSTPLFLRNLCQNLCQNTANCIRIVRLVGTIRFCIPSNIRFLWISRFLLLPSLPVRHFQFLQTDTFVVPAAAAKARSRSSRMSSGCSMPMDRRTSSGVMPPARCCSSLSWLWVVVAG